MVSVARRGTIPHTILNELFAFYRLGRILLFEFEKRMIEIGDLELNDCEHPM